jgi:hypothetical protein
MTHNRIEKRLAGASTLVEMLGGDCDHPGILPRATLIGVVLPL